MSPIDSTGDSARRYQALMEHSLDGVCVLDSELRIVYMSPSASRSAEMLQEIGTANVLSQLIHPDDRAEAERYVTETLRKPEQPSPFEIRARSQDGSWMWIAGVITNLLHEAAVGGIVVNFRDITGIKAAEEERRLLVAELLQAQRMEAIGRLADGIAHTFNNLLTTITGYAELMLAKLPEDFDSRAEAREIRRAAASAQAVTRGLLDFSHREAVSRERIDLNEIVLATESLLRPLLGPGIKLETTMEPGLRSIEGNRSELEQVIVNLALNARDAMPDGGTLGIETATFALASTPMDIGQALTPGRYVALYVRDTGIGMDDVTQARIFEPFFTTKSVEHGSGLGLSSVYGIVNNAGGRILVDSAPGQGATFTVYFPESGREL